MLQVTRKNERIVPTTPPYPPPYTLTPEVLRLVAEFSELIGCSTAIAENQMTPRLRRENRIRTIQASHPSLNNLMPSMPMLT